MATAIAPRSSVQPADLDQVVALQGVGWEGYEEVLRIRDGHSRPRILYVDGDLYLLSPGHSHERDVDRFHTFVVEVTVGLRLPMHFARSTTLRRRVKDGGVEPDQSFYLTNAHLVRNKKDIRLDVDPPPDLSIEVVYSHSAANAIEISRRLGIPEVWVCDESELKFLVLGPDGHYAESAKSMAFPDLTSPEVLDWIRRPEGDEASDSDWVFDLRQWVRETLAPRAANRRV